MRLIIPLLALVVAASCVREPAMGFDRNTCDLIMIAEGYSVHTIELWKDSLILFDTAFRPAIPLEPEQRIHLCELAGEEDVNGHGQFLLLVNVDCESENCFSKLDLSWHGEERNKVIDTLWFHTM